MSVRVKEWLGEHCKSHLQAPGAWGLYFQGEDIHPNTTSLLVSIFSAQRTEDRCFLVFRSLNGIPSPNLVVECLSQWFSIMKKPAMNILFPKYLL